MLPEGSVGKCDPLRSRRRACSSPTTRSIVFFWSVRTGKDVKTYFHSDDFNQPNDLTIATDGTIYASDPHWKQHDGQIWRISKSADGEAIGEKMTADRRMSTTNGIDLSPDGKTLYVGESDTREIWAYRIDGTRLLSPGLVKRFDDFDIDGLRTDTDGNLFVARILKGTIAELISAGKIEAGDTAHRPGTDQPRLRRH